MVFITNEPIVDPTLSLPALKYSTKKFELSTGKVNLKPFPEVILGAWISSKSSISWQKVLENYWSWNHWKLSESEGTLWWASMCRYVSRACFRNQFRFEKSSSVPRDRFFQSKLRLIFRLIGHYFCTKERSQTLSQFLAQQLAHIKTAKNEVVLYLTRNFHTVCKRKSLVTACTSWTSRFYSQIYLKHENLAPCINSWALKVTPRDPEPKISRNFGQVHTQRHCNDLSHKDYRN